MSQLQTLDELGIRHVTDKSSLCHDYLVKYERLFAPFRDLPFTLLEIGVFNGGSLKLWEEYFPRATIVGLDINPACKTYEGGRRVVEIVSQADAVAMAEIGKKYRASIIIDDGSHQADHILISFQALYHSLHPGGLYIVEDIGMHSGSQAALHRGSAVMSPQQYFLKLANRIVCPGDEVEFDAQIPHYTESVEFFQDVAAIRKKQLPAPDQIEVRRALVENLNSDESWGWFSNYLLTHGGSFDEAIECAMRAREMAPHSIAHIRELSVVLEHAGRLDEALAAAEDVARRVPHYTHFSHEVTRLAAKIEERRKAQP